MVGKNTAGSNSVVPSDIQIFQVCARIVSVAYDNGRTPGSSEGPGAPNFIQFGWTFTESSLNINCRDEDTGAVGPYTQWTPQLQGWADAFNALGLPNTFAAFGRKPAPTWRYNKVTTCNPNAQFGTWTLLRDTGDEYKVYPVCKVEEKVIAWRYFTLEKDKTKTVHWCQPDPDNPDKFIEAEAPTWEPVEGDGQVPIPEECFVSCDYDFGPCIKEDAKSSCETREYNLCDLVDPEDPDSKVEFVRVVDRCENGQFYVFDYTLESYLTATDPDALVAYELVNPTPVYCDTCEPFDNCPDRVTTKETMCVESQEWTYGIDNTGTNFRWPSACYEIELSDGSIISFEQTVSATSGWTPQMQEWGANIQAAADASGLQWFVSTRFRFPNNPSNLAGAGGFPGPPSEAVSNQLTSMLWRYVNIQICPGQPVPVSARLVEVKDAGGFSVPDLPRELTTDGAVLGPIQKFWLCKSCGKKPIWYLEDGVTKATEGQIPDCWEPCGTLALTSSPPDRACEFSFDTACDNNNDPNSGSWTNLVTRRVTYCNGEQVAQEFFIPDPDNPQALIDYTLVGEFVDCATGEVVPVEPPSKQFSDEIKFSWQYGYICDEKDERLCDPVRWLEGEYQGKPCYPEGNCPTYYPGKYNSSEGASCTIALDPQPLQVSVDKPAKTVTTDTLTYCAFLDGDLTNCDVVNVVEFIRVFENCIIDGKIAKRDFIDYELDGVTPLDDSGFTEDTVSIECSRDDDGNLLICHETCYVYNPPVIVKPVKGVKSVKSLAVAIKSLKSISKKRVLTATEKRRLEESVRALAIESGADVVEPSKFVRGTCLKVRECCPCGDPTNIVSQEFLVQGPQDTEFTEVPAFEVTGVWTEKACDPSLDCPDDLVGLNDCTIASLTEGDCQYRCSFPGVGTDRNGIRNGGQTTNFTLTLSTGETYTGATFAELTTAMETDGYELTCECESAECHISTLVISGPEEVVSVNYTNAQAGEINLTNPTCIEIPCGWQLTQELIDLETPCCDPRIISDAICFDQEVVLGDITVPAGEPVLRQIVFRREYNAKTCSCEDLPGEGSVLFYDFLNPTNDITDEVEAAVEAGAVFTLCTPISSSQKELCDDKGNRYFIVTLTVGANGNTAATTVYNQDGVSVEIPEGLQPCPGNLNSSCGCVKDASGNVVHRNVLLWTGVNDAGGKLNGGITQNDDTLSEITLAEGEYFTCDCKDKCADTVVDTKYAYTFGEVFPCESPTITIDEEIVPLCEGGPGPSNIPTSGDICTVGGIRSQLTLDFSRCAHLTPPLLTSDDADYATELLNFGSAGDPANNPTVNAFTTANSGGTANIMVAVRGTYPGLAGQTGISISINNTWRVGSGIALGALHCNGDGTTTVMELIGGTPSGYASECNPETTQGPNASWGSVNNGLSQSSVYQLPGGVSFDFEDVIFYTVVLNPSSANGDILDGFIVEGESIAAPEGCEVANVAELVTLINSETDLGATLVDGVICINTDKILGPITCGSPITDSVDPVVTSTTKDIEADFVALAPKDRQLIKDLIAKQCETADLLRCVEETKIASQKTGTINVRVKADINPATFSQETNDASTMCIDFLDCPEVAAAEIPFATTPMEYVDIDGSPILTNPITSTNQWAVDNGLADCVNLDGCDFYERNTIYTLQLPLGVGAIEVAMKTRGGSTWTTTLAADGTVSTLDDNGDLIANESQVKPSNQRAFSTLEVEEREDSSINQDVYNKMVEASTETSRVNGRVRKVVGRRIDTQIQYESARCSREDMEDLASAERMEKYVKKAQDLLCKEFPELTFEPTSNGATFVDKISLKEDAEFCDLKQRYREWDGVFNRFKMSDVDFIPYVAKRPLTRKEISVFMNRFRDLEGLNVDGVKIDIYAFSGKPGE